MARRTDRTRVSEFAAVPAIAVVIVGALLWAAGGWSARSSTEHFYPWQVKFALLCCALALQLTARRYPAAAFWLMLAVVAWDLVFGPSVVLWIALSDVIYLATMLGGERLRRVVAGAALTLTVLAAMAATAVAGVTAGIYTTLILVALTWSPIGYAKAVLAHRRLADLERSRSGDLRVAAVTEERRRLARDLHDTVAGHLAAVAILADAAQRTPTDPAVLQSIRTASLAALEEMRSTIDLLTAPDDTAVRTTLASLEPLIDGAVAAGGSVQLTGPEQGSLPVAVEATLTRILGEAITNAAKHAPGSPLRIDVVKGEHELHAVATNPTHDRQSARTGVGSGVRNMMFRAESVGGRVTAGPEDRCWVVRARLPLRVAEQ